MAGVVGSLSFAGDAEGLAGVAAVEDVDGGDGVVEFAHVGQDGDAGEPLLEHAAAVGVVFAQPCGFGGEGVVDGEVESAEPGEEAAGSHVTPTP